MRAVTETGSRRKLTSCRLIVDWNGYGTLFYQMTKLQMRQVFAGAKTITIQGKQADYCSNTGFSKLTNEYSHLTFPIKRTQSRWFAIGCEYFTKDEVKELRQWCKQ
jgi:hypothetical protein